MDATTVEIDGLLDEVTAGKEEVTAPFLSLAQIRNRLVLTARAILRDHRPGPDGRCPICQIADCPVSAAARNVLRAAEEVPQRSIAIEPTEPDPDGSHQAG